MRNSCLTLVLLICVVAIADTVMADMVILKSGEMFQTRKAWKENGIVNYYQNGRVVRVDEQDVERLIHSQAPAESKQRPIADPPPPPADYSPPVQMPKGKDAGYLNLKWGLTPSQIEGLVFVETDPAYGGVALYTINERNESFGRASVDDIVYGFWQGGLYTITVWTRNFLDFRAMKAEAFRRFGTGLKNRNDVEKYYWMDNSADRMLSYDFNSDTGYLWMRSRDLHEKVKSLPPE